MATQSSNFLKELSEVFNYYTREDMDTKLEAISQGLQGEQGPQGLKGEQGLQGKTGTFDENATFNKLQTTNKTVLGAINELKGQIGSFKIWIGSKEEYNAIALKDSYTLYFIKEE